MIKIFADGADLSKMRELADREDISGFTTNPTLMRKSGVTDYAKFAREALMMATGRPVSFEVFSDDLEEMGRQARKIAAWAANAYVKIPVTDTRGNFTGSLITALAGEGVPLNVTAVFTRRQVVEVRDALDSVNSPAIISVFAGRVADAGVDPYVHMQGCLRDLRGVGAVELLWASPRQVYDLALAERAGCHIITLSPDLIDKLPLLGKDLTEYSRETVEMFYRDAQAAGFAL